MNGYISNLRCSACGDFLVNSGKIEDGYYLRCTSCGSARIGIEDYEPLKNQSGYGEAYNNACDPNKVEQLLNIFFKYHSGPSQLKTVFDVGFGTGDFIKSLKKLRWNVSGVDCNSEAVEEIKNDGIAAYKGELGGSLKTEGRFDIITMWDVIEHVEKIDAAMEQLSALTSPGGEVFVITPDAGSLLDKIGRFEKLISFGKSTRILNVCLNRYHLHRFSREGIKILFEKYGFKIKEISAIRLFSLRPDVYCSSFSPGIKSWSGSKYINRILSLFLFKLSGLFAVKNKLLAIAIKDEV